MRKVDQHIQNLLDRLPNQLGYTDTLHRQIIQILFQIYYFERKKRWTWISSKSIQILKQDQIIWLYDKLKGLTDVSLLYDVLHHKPIPTISDPKIKHFIQINNKLDQGSITSIMTVLQGCLESKWNTKWTLARIEQSDPHTYFIINDPCNEIREAQPKDLHWIEQGYRKFMLDTDIGKINWLLSTPISSYKLHQLGSINKSTIVKLRDHKRQVQNLTLNNAIKFKRLADYLRSNSKFRDTEYSKKHPDYLQQNQIKTEDQLMKTNYQNNYGLKL